MPVPLSQAPRLGVHAPALDGVRGIAILVVMLGHFSLEFRPTNTGEALLVSALQTGWWGVDLFFVLSGFLITSILLVSKGSPHYFRNFYLRRVLRIFPLYYAFLFAFFILAPLVRPPTPGGPFDQWRDSQWWFWTYLSNLQILFPDWARPYPLTHFWTLALEEQFYLFWPAVVLATSRRGLIRLCIVLLFACLLVRAGMHLAGVDPTAGYRITPARLDTLALGGLLAALLADPDWWPRLRTYAGVVFLACLAGLAALSIPTRALSQHSFLMQTLGFPMLGFLSASLVVFGLDTAHNRPLLTRAFDWRGLKTMGKYSYAMYVLHFPLTQVLSRGGISIPVMTQMTGSQTVGLLIFVITAGLVTYVLALMSWHLFEKHFLRLKRFFPRREDPTPASSKADGLITA